MSQIILKNLRGINATKAKLQLQAGEPSGLQNVRNRPLNTWTKRQGVEPVETSSDPYMGIFDVELDDVIIPVIIKGGDWTFYPSSLPVSENHPLTDVDWSATYTLFNIEKTMRAMQERLLWAYRSGYAFPSAHFGSDLIYDSNPDAMTTVNANEYISTSSLGTFPFPVNGYYKYDLSLMDSHNNSPGGTFATSLVAKIFDAYAGLANANVYIMVIDGETDVRYYDSDYYTSNVLPYYPTIRTYRQSLEKIKSEIRRLTSFDARFATSFLDASNGHNYQIDGFSPSLITSADLVELSGYLASVPNQKIDEYTKASGSWVFYGRYPAFWGTSNGGFSQIIWPAGDHVVLSHQGLITFRRYGVFVKGGSSVIYIANKNRTTNTLDTTAAPYTDQLWHKTSETPALGVNTTGAIYWGDRPPSVVTSAVLKDNGYGIYLTGVVTPLFDVSI